MTDEEEEAIKYYKNKDTSFSVEFESKMSEDKFYEMLGITKEDTFEKHQIRFQTLLNLIEKQDNTIKGNECVIETMAHNEEVLLEVIEKKDKIIDRMANEIYIEHNPHFKTTEEVKEYFEKEEE